MTSFAQSWADATALSPEDSGLTNRPREWSKYLDGVVNRELRATADLPGKARNAASHESTMRDLQDRKVITLPRFMPTESPKFATFAALAEWEGVVTSVQGNAFTAQLVRFGGTGDAEFAEIPVEELGDYERATLKDGAVFRWAVGYARLPSGQKLRTSSIYFKRYIADVSASGRSATLGGLFEGSVD